jgi:hypothetical protein
MGFFSICAQNPILEALLETLGDAHNFYFYELQISEKYISNCSKNKNYFYGLQISDKYVPNYSQMSKTEHTKTKIQRPFSSLLPPVQASSSRCGTSGSSRRRDPAPELEGAVDLAPPLGSSPRHRDEAGPTRWREQQPPCGRRWREQQLACWWGRKEQADRKSRARASGNNRVSFRNLLIWFTHQKTSRECGHVARLSRSFGSSAWTAQIEGP